jgi:hypothetical protein
MIDRSQFLSSVRRVAIFSKNNAPNSFKIAGAELNVSKISTIRIKQKKIDL